MALTYNTSVDARKGIVQTRVMETNVLRTFSAGNDSWVEPSSDYRISIQPVFSDSLILLNYYIPFNQYSGGANNIFGFRAYRFSPNATSSITSAGQSSGSRRQMAGGNARAQNGYDVNDHNMESFIAYDKPATRNTCIYGFQMYREGSDAGTIYLGYSSSNNGTWGMSTRLVITATEIRE